MASAEGRPAGGERSAAVALTAVRNSLANLVTVARLLAIPPAGWLLLTGRVDLALVLISFAVFSDAVDGWLARRFGTTTLGSWLDAAADRLLIATVLASLWWTDILPLWIVVVLVGREALVALGALLAGKPDRPLAPLRIGKLHTAAAFTLLVVGVAVAGGWLSPRAVELTGAVVLTTSLVSFVVYAHRLWQLGSGR